MAPRYLEATFLRRVRDFKPTKRFYKNIGQEVVSIGFPPESYQKHPGDRTASSVTSNRYLPEHI